MFWKENSLSGEEYGWWRETGVGVTRGRETIKEADEEERGPQPRLEDNGE